MPAPAQHRLLGRRRLRRVRASPTPRSSASVPAGIDPLDAAPLTCAGVTTYKAVKVSGARSSDLVAVFGVGGLGHLALQYARIAGATVVAVDVIDDKLQLAKHLGAKYTVNATTRGSRRGHPGPRRRRRGDRHSPPARAARAGLRLAAPRRPLVLVGLPADNRMRLPIFETVLKGITVTGSIVGTRVDLAETFELHAAGRTTVIRETRRSSRSTRRSPRSCTATSTPGWSSTCAEVRDYAAACVPYVISGHR